MFGVLERRRDSSSQPLHLLHERERRRFRHRSRRGVVGGGGGDTPLTRPTQRARAKDQGCPTCVLDSILHSGKHAISKTAVNDKENRQTGRGALRVSENRRAPLPDTDDVPGVNPVVAIATEVAS